MVAHFSHTQTTVLLAVASRTPAPVSSAHTSLQAKTPLASAAHITPRPIQRTDNHEHSSAIQEPRQLQANGDEWEKRHR